VGKGIGGAVLMAAIVLITGGTGFLGSRLAEMLLDEGYHVYIVTHNDDFSKNRVENAKYVPGDIRISAHGPFVHSNPKIVIHMAAMTPVRFSYDNAWKYYQTNVVGTANVISEAMQFKVQHVVFASTAEVYPYMKQEYYWSEDDNLSITSASSPYAASKRGAEEIVKEAGARGLKYTILRPTNTYGRAIPALPQESSGYFIEKAVTFMLTRQNEVLRFDGLPESKRQWMHWRDHISAYMKVIENEKAHGMTFNVAPDAAYSCQQVVEKLRRMTDFYSDITWGHNPRPIEPNLLLLNPSRIKELLGWSAKVSLDEGLSDTVKQYRKIMRSLY
jgi:UDP-glucose 4-epimerase